MTRLYRPYIPLTVRVAVAERQVRETGHISWPLYLSARDALPLYGRLAALLKLLFGDQACQLDHDPALEQRSKGVRKGKSYYIPDANDPRYLVYREKADHLFKTTGRRPGATTTVTHKGSDSWLRKKFNRLEGLTKCPRKSKLPNRPFPKGKRKLPARPLSPLFGKPRGRR